jgi:hypothetical protein
LGVPFDFPPNNLANFNKNIEKNINNEINKKPDFTGFGLNAMVLTCLLYKALKRFIRNGG